MPGLRHGFAPARGGHFAGRAGLLVPGQGRLLTMFAPDALPVARAEQLIAQAPPGGYAEWPAAFARNWVGHGRSSDRWLRARMEATHRWQAWQEELLIDASQPYPAIVARHWGDPADR
jgi:general secretion pathway protein K